MTPQDLHPGTQIIYVPNHADGIDHPDSQRGFVTSMTKHGAFCRYWNKHNPEKLRTMANSELTPFDNLVIKDTHSQGEVNKWLRWIRDEER